MGRRRRNLFVLLFVLGLVIVSALVIAKKPTKLGLDLKGGLELIYQGTPTGQVKEVSGEDIDRAIEIIRQRIDQLGVSEPEVARLGTDEISVAMPDITDPTRAREQVGTTAQLYFYDWEPSLIGREFAIGGHPGRTPPAAPLKEAKEEWKEAGRAPKKGESPEEKTGTQRRNRTADLRRRLPERLRRGPARRRTEAGLGRRMRRKELLDDEAELLPLLRRRQARADLRPRDEQEGPLHQRHRAQNRPQGRSRRGAGRDRRRLRTAPGRRWGADRRLRTRLVRAERRTGADRDRNHQPRSEKPGRQLAVVFEFTDSGREAFHDVTRRIAQRGQEQAIGLAGGEEAAEALSGHFAVVLDNEVKTRPIINFSENPDGIDGRTGAQISGGFKSISDAQELAETLQIGALPINLKLISQTQVSATLGTQALHRGSKPGSSAWR